MKPEQERVHSLLKDTVSLLCKNGLSYSQHLKIEGVLGITVDNDVFIVHLDDKYEEEVEKEPVVHPDSSARDIAASDSVDMHIKPEPGFDLEDDEDLIIMESDIKEEPSFFNNPNRKRPHPRSTDGPQRKVHNLSHRLTQSADTAHIGSPAEQPYITGVMKDIDSIGDASLLDNPGFDSAGSDLGRAHQHGGLHPQHTQGATSPGGSWPPEGQGRTLLLNPRRRYRQYTSDDLTQACRAVCGGSLVVKQASTMYNIPTRTIYDHLKHLRNKEPENTDSGNAATSAGNMGTTC